MPKFDVVIGNPPYQAESYKGSRPFGAPIYPVFMDAAGNMGRKAVLITPARFLFNAGATSKIWNRKMLNSPHFRLVYYEGDSSKVFSNVDITGGIVVTIMDEHVLHDPITLFIPNVELASIEDKVSNLENAPFVEFSSMMFTQIKFNVEYLKSSHPDIKARMVNIDKDKRLTTSIFKSVPELFSDAPSDESDIAIYGRYNNQRVYKYIAIDFLEPHGNVDKWKVILPKAYGSGKIGEVINKPIVAGPSISHTQTFVSIGSFDSEAHAYACLSYIKTKFARVLLSVLKVTQNTPPFTYRHIPLQDFTEQSDIDWSQSISDIDQQLYRKYKLNEKEVNFIESHVKPMA